MLKNDLIKRCIKQERQAQNEFYQKYAPSMMGVCRRYMADDLQAEACLVGGFLKIFKNLKNLKNNKSLEGWMRKVMVNECLMELRKKRNFNITLESVSYTIETSDNVLENIDRQQIIELFDCLPVGYRTVLNLFVIEGYSHKEISEQLGISENTSKSQLAKSRRRLKEIINALNIAG